MAYRLRRSQPEDHVVPKACERDRRQTHRGSRPARAWEHETEEWAQRLSSSGEFTVVHVDQFRWSIDLDATQVHGLFSTFSDWRPDEVAAAADAVRQLGGTVTEHYITPLILLKRADHVSHPNARAIAVRRRRGRWAPDAVPPDA